MVQVVLLRPLSRKYGLRSSRAMVISAATPGASCVCSPQITMVRSAPANTVTNFPSPVLVYPMLHRRIGDAEWRFGILGLRDQVAPQVLIVVVVKAYEHPFCNHPPSQCSGCLHLSYQKSGFRYWACSTRCFWICRRRSHSARPTPAINHGTGVFSQSLVDSMKVLPSINFLRFSHVHSCISSLSSAVRGFVQMPSLRPFRRKYGLPSSRAILNSSATPVAV